MLLKDKSTVIYGAAGAVGSAMARAFAAAGANVFLTGRDLAVLASVAKDISAAGGFAEAAVVDALDEPQIERHLDTVIEKAGRIDISFNAIGIPQQGIQGISLADLPVESFDLPVITYTRSHFLTARAAVRRMVKQGGGVILMHTPEPARLSAPLVGGMAPAWAAMEALSRNLSAEYGTQGVRAVVLRSTGLPETHTIDVVFGLHGKALGISRDQFRALMEGMGHSNRSTTLAELTQAGVFAASLSGSAMTGGVVNLTGGKIAD